VVKIFCSETPRTTIEKAISDEVLSLSARIKKEEIKHSSLNEELVIIDPNGSESNEEEEVVSSRSIDTPTALRPSDKDNNQVQKDRKIRKIKQLYVQQGKLDDNKDRKRIKKSATIQPIHKQKISPKNKPLSSSSPNIHSKVSSKQDKKIADDKNKSITEDKFKSEEKIKLEDKTKIEDKNKSNLEERLKLEKSDDKIKAEDKLKPVVRSESGKTIAAVQKLQGKSGQQEVGTGGNTDWKELEASILDQTSGNVLANIEKWRSFDEAKDREIQKNPYKSMEKVKDDTKDKTVKNTTPVRRGPSANPAESIVREEMKKLEEEKRKLEEEKRKLEDEKKRIESERKKIEMEKRKVEKLDKKEDKEKKSKKESNKKEIEKK